MKKLLIILVPFLLTGCITLGKPQLVGVEKIPGTKDKNEVYEQQPTWFGKIFGVKVKTYKKRVVVESSFDELRGLMKSIGRWAIIGGLALIIICTVVMFAFQNRALQGFLSAGALLGLVSFLAGIITFLMSSPWVLAGVVIAILVGAGLWAYFVIKNRDHSLINDGKMAWCWLKQKREAFNGS